MQSRDRGDYYALKKVKRRPRLRRKPNIFSQETAMVAREGPKPDFNLVWPSGYGVEIASIRSSLNNIWDTVDRNAPKASKSFDMHLIEDDGINCFVILKLLHTPVCFVADEVDASDVLSVTVDSQADVDAVLNEISKIIPQGIQVNGAHV